MPITIQGGELPTVVNLPNAVQNMDATFTACDSIVSQMIIQNGATTTDVTYKASKSITLLPGFHAMAGVNFTAQIEDNCQTNSVQSDEEVAALDREIATQELSTNSILGPKATLKVFPNPFASQATIEIVLPEERNIQLNLYSLQGKLLKSVIPTASFSSGVHQLALEATEFPTGIYLLMLNTPKEVISQKLIITH